MAQRTPADWMEAYLTALHYVRSVPLDVALEGVLALAARVECSQISMSCDCETCPLYETCSRYGMIDARSGREWWPVRA